MALSGSALTSVGVRQEDASILWEFSNVAFKAYPEGRKDPLEKPAPSSGPPTITARVDLQKRAMEFNRLILPHYEKCIHLGHKKIVVNAFMDPRILDLLYAFSRFPQNGDDLSTPFDTAHNRTMAASLRLELSTMSLPAEACQLVNTSITAYLTAITPQLENWIHFADEHFLEPWRNIKGFFGGYDCFSELASATTCHFIFGVPLEMAKKQKFSSIWNTLFSDETGFVAGISRLKTSVWDYPRLRAFLLGLVRKEMQTPSSDSKQTVIRYWIDTALVQQVRSALPEDYLAKCEKSAREEKISLDEKILVDSMVTLMIEMQQNFAFAMTALMKRFADDVWLAGQCHSNDMLLSVTILETLRVTPAAGSSRQMRWDTDVYIDGTKFYQLVKGETITTNPIYLRAFVERINPHGFDPDAKPAAENIFGQGCHHCPGESLALLWMKRLTHRILEYYQVTAKPQPSHEVVIGLTARHAPPLEFKLSPVMRISYGAYDEAVVVDRDDPSIYTVNGD